MAKNAKKEVSVGIEIPKMKREHFFIEVEGTAPIIIHKFSDKAQKQIEDKQQGKAKAGRDKRDPIEDFLNCFYFLGPVDVLGIYDKMKKDNVTPGSDVTKYFKGVRVGFPASGFKKSAVNACRFLSDIKMTFARGAFFVREETMGCIEIKYKRLILRQDPVRLPNRSGGVTYRPGFEDWTASFEVESNSLALTAAQIYNLFDIAGFSVGVGDGRPGSSNGGTENGTYKVVLK